MRRFERTRQFADKYFWESVMLLWGVPFCFSAFSPHCFWLVSFAFVHLLGSISIFLSFPCVMLVMLLLCRGAKADEDKARRAFRHFALKDLICTSFLNILFMEEAVGVDISNFFKANIPRELGLMAATLGIALILCAIGELSKKPDEEA